MFTAGYNSKKYEVSSKELFCKNSFGWSLDQNASLKVLRELSWLLVQWARAFRTVYAVIEGRQWVLFRKENQTDRGLFFNSTLYSTRSYKSAACQKASAKWFCFTRKIEKFCVKCRQCSFNIRADILQLLRKKSKRYHLMNESVKKQF